MSLRDSTSWFVRVAVLVLVVWLAWAVGWFVWAASDSALRSADAHMGFMVYVVMVAIAACVCVVAAVQGPGMGEVVGGLILTGIGIIGGTWAAVQLLRWGEIVDRAPDRVTPWVPWDSLAALPFTLLLPAGILLLVGGIKHEHEKTHGSARAGTTV
jgi:hypothetical protein